MQKLFENWRRFVEEDNKALESKIRAALAEEGGAADMETLKEYTGATEEEIKSAMGDWEGIEEHPGSSDFRKNILLEGQRENLPEWFKEWLGDFLEKDLDAPGAKEYFRNRSAPMPPATDLEGYRGRGGGFPARWDRPPIPPIHASSTGRQAPHLDLQGRPKAPGEQRWRRWADRALGLPPHPEPVAGAGHRAVPASRRELRSAHNKNKSRLVNDIRREATIIEKAVPRRPGAFKQFLQKARNIPFLGNFFKLALLGYVGTDILTRADNAYASQGVIGVSKTIAEESLLFLPSYIEISLIASALEEAFPDIVFPGKWKRDKYWKSSKYDVEDYPGGSEEETPEEDVGPLPDV